VEIENEMGMETVAHVRLRICFYWYLS
jgi:hypothetical protein